MNINETVNNAFLAKEVFGVDPGTSNGGIVKYNPSEAKKYESWPISKMNKFEELCDFWEYQKEICKLPLVFIEKINMYAGDFDNRGRMFQMKKLQDHYVELKSSLKSKKIDFVEVMPISWQKTIKVHIPNEESSIRKRRLKDIACEYFPGQHVVGWNADAYLLIEFARTKLKYDPKWVIRKKGLKNIQNLFKNG